MQRQLDQVHVVMAGSPDPEGTKDQAGTATNLLSKVSEQQGQLFDKPHVDLQRKRYHEYIDDVQDEVTKHSPED